MTAAAVCASHTPLMSFVDPGEDVAREVAACLRDVRSRVAAYDPSLVVVFGPDHFNGFFYRMMPPFCVGAAAEAIGDWQTPSGPMPVDAAAAERCVAHLHAKGVDAAISHRMEVDHGLTQTLSLLFDWSSMPRLLPIFLNCAAPPRAPIARILALGDALGSFLAGLDERVLLIGSGGISHDPPVAALATATPEVRERLIAGGVLPPEARAARQERVLAEGRMQAAGTSQSTPLNPAWDRRFLDSLRGADFQRLSALTDDEITRDGGRGGHEIRTWIAVAAAMHGLGASPPEVRYYRPIPEWVAGFGVMTIDLPSA